MCKPLNLSGLLFAVLLIIIPPANANETEQVLAVVTGVFDGMRNKDAALLESQFAEGASIGNMTVDDFVTAVTTNAAHLDEVTFDETVLIDGDLAMAWTPYNIFVDGVFHHCGVDLFTMKRIGDRWLISALEDTRRTEGCDETRRQ